MSMNLDTKRWTKERWIQWGRVEDAVRSLEMDAVEGPADLKDIQKRAALRRREVGLSVGSAATVIAAAHGSVRALARLETW